MNVKSRVMVGVLVDEAPRVRFDDHGEVRALVQLSPGGEENVVELAFDDPRHLRSWAAGLVAAVDRRYGGDASDSAT